MVLLKFCSKSFRRKPSALARDARHDQVPQPSDALPPQSPPPRPVPVASKTPNRKKDYGLEVLYDGRLCADNQDGAGLDIVAIHGLNGNAYSTWRHKNGTMWLKDLLPSDLPGARIFTYAYPAEVLFSKSVGDIIDYSRSLLAELQGQLTTTSEVNMLRPIIFVCHSLGGLVCKQALLLAKEPKSQYGDILAATTAVIFLGTPHRGSRIADTGKAVGDFANALLRVAQVTSLTGAIRSDLVSALSADSDSLQALATSFHDQLDHLDIVTFYERKIAFPLSSLVVDRESAIMGIPGEQVIPLNADHRSMCRFEAKNTEYLTVLNQIRRLSRGIKPSRDSANKSLRSTETRCMTLLYSTNLEDYKAQLPRPVQGTCSWILRDQRYISWIESEDTGLLWVTALDSAAQSFSQVFYFFCDDKITTQRNARQILRSILHQILQQHRSLIKYAKSRWEATGHNLVESFAALWGIFLKIISESRLGPVGIIVDAIDECEADSRRTFLQSIMHLVQESGTAPHRPRNLVKFLITSRPSPQDFSILEEPDKSILPIDENQARISQDIRLVISHRFGRLAKKVGFSKETITELETLLLCKAEKSFLWLNIVLQSLEDSQSTSKKDFKQIINNFPRKLEATYARFLHRILPDSRDIARNILRILIGSSRSLTLQEMNIAYTINQGEYRTVEKLTEDRQNAIERMLHGIVGPFVRFEASRVSFIHQSVKDFLAGFALSSTDDMVQSFGISPPVAALGIASTCIRYLLLEDFATDIFLPIMTDNSLSDHKKDDDEASNSSSLDFLADGPLPDYEEDLRKENCTFITKRFELFDYAATHWAEHFALCESIAPESLWEAVRALTQGGSHVLKNWLKYFWIKTEMEFALPDDFDAIMVAAFFDCALLLDESMRLDVSVDQTRKDRALFWAARMGCSNSVEVLLIRGADPNSRRLYQHTPLTIAAHHGHLRAVKVLLADARTNVNTEGKSGRTALSFAAGNSHLETFEVLFSCKDCRPDHQDENHWTPLFWAIERDHTDIARLLLRHPAVNINHVDRNGRSILSWAAGEGFLGAFRMFLGHPEVDVNLKDANGRSPLLWAANNGQEEIIDAFMRDEHSVDRMSKDNDRRNALSLACMGGHTDTVKALIKYGCGDEGEEDVDGWTALPWALERRSPLTVEAVLAGRGVQVDRRDRTGRTALLWAASYGYADVVQMLMDQGADPHIRDESDREALDYAQMFNHIEVRIDKEWNIYFEDWVEGQKEKMLRGLDQFEVAAKECLLPVPGAGPTSADEVAVAAATAMTSQIVYLWIGWKQDRPKLEE
ncbi:uncharacterized protein K460DRAFT_419391 [Cucurbitaria berberidis CBS 394.84]|uniref:DUF676 domain-containing protein n=1 Tax=Cucurbitaria berberidis CBS 394.84 TaxID=1168544 RepID=A0A9P4G942_9PLEO|nr:uncharacterized protein K460DRAFT_419391 [Cucurbitaria berberidis CBS 394.84]KAF1841306.1 hypothetical protein K460DRAFT_419391 [Cucurbitaria berberidis CBS 394.84]